MTALNACRTPDFCFEGDIEPLQSGSDFNDPLMQRLDRLFEERKNARAHIDQMALVIEQLSLFHP